MAEKASIYTQLVALIADVPGMDRSGNNPHFGSKYITFDEIMSKLRPLFKKHGIAIAHRVENDVLDGGLIEVSVTPLAVNGAGETIEGGTMKNVVPNNVQQIGSVTTYLKRYSIAAFLGIAADVDDDGEANRELMERHGLTQEGAEKAVERYKRAPKAQGPQAGKQQPLRTTSSAQAAEIKEIIKARNITREEYDSIQVQALGKAGTLDKLTTMQADLLIQALKDYNAPAAAPEPEPEPEPKPKQEYSQDDYIAAIHGDDE